MKIFVEYPSDGCDGYWGVYTFCQDKVMFQNLLSTLFNEGDWSEVEIRGKRVEGPPHIISKARITTLIEAASWIGDVVLLNKEYIYVERFMMDIREHLEGGESE